MKDAERTNRDTPAALDAIPERYWRNARFLSRTDQEKLLQAHVVIIGLGGLGGTVLEELLRLGIGTITGVDMDVFELSNLNRQLLATEENIGLHKAENSYFHRAMCAQDYSAVTAACLMTKKSVFDAVGGLSEELAVAFNDIDYCMKVRALGKLVVYAPYACFYHYESKSRGLEDTPEKVERFNREIKIFSEKWPEILKNGDPYYNPNLTLRKSNFALRDLKKEKIGEPYDLKIYEQFAPEDK